MSINKNNPLAAYILPAILFLLCLNVNAQRGKKAQPTPDYFPEHFNGMEYRSIGPFRGGRSATVTGVPGKTNLFYMGTTGGGVWKTTDGGSSWENISDEYFGGSIGSVAVSEKDPNVIYVGGGEKTVRGNVSYGYGVWKSVDAGETWNFTGLKSSRHIPRMRIHPDNPDLVYAAVLGDLYKPDTNRGVYRSKDGGVTWEKILFANENAGAIDLILDPNNPRIIYASTWRVRRTPYSLESGGDGSDLWKSTDSGDHWEKISGNEGLPGGVWGIVGITVSPANSQRLWAIIENKNGGVYRSDDAGKTWTKTNEDRSLRQRAWYYSRIYADTKDEDKVYVLNVSYHRSKDGGKTFESFNAPHGDHHDLWIAPEDNSRMIIGDDGGGQVSFDGGENWSTYHNQPTSQFYRVTTDNHFPYRIYGAQQDNSTVRILHRTNGNAIEERDWEATAGGESAHIAVDPEDSDIVYGGSYDGFLTRFNHHTDEVRAINVWPDNPMGHGAEGMKYRFQWNFPVFISPHNPDKLYAASNHLHVSYNEGQSWETISPDLTRNDSTKLGPSGGPITKDNTSVEYYCTIFAAAESPLEKDVIWTGSDDGLIHISRDGGNTWNNVTPSWPSWTMVNSIEIDPFQKGGVYVAGTRYKLGDYKPYLFKTSDYGKTWQAINNGIESDHFTRVIRADPKREGLLYAGTETGMYISYNDGLEWHPFQLNLPVVPITDLAIKNDNLIVATQGRGFWIIDDLTPLHQYQPALLSSTFYLYQPMPSYRMPGSQRKPSKTEGQNHPGGVMVHYYLKDTALIDTLTLEFLDERGELIRSFSNIKDEEKEEKPIELENGFNRFVWDMRYPPAEKFDGMILWWSSLQGPKAIPGTYSVRITIDGNSSTKTFEIIPDPRSSASLADLQEQFDFLMGVRNKLTETNLAIKNIRKIKSDLAVVKKRIKGDEQLKSILELAEEIEKKITTVEESLYQTQNKSNQDPLNFPIRLNNKLGHLNSLSGYGDYKPTDQAKSFREEVEKSIDNELNKLNEILTRDIPEFNQKVKESEIDAIKPDLPERKINP